MTNLEIIVGSMIVAGLDPLTVEVDTYAGWKRKGFVVKRGETAVFKTKIWKPCKRKADDEFDEEEKQLYLVNAAFFTEDQVEKVGEQK